MHAVLVGNKCDLRERRVVPQEEIEETATNLGVPYFECSAKESLGPYCRVTFKVWISKSWFAVLYLKSAVFIMHFCWYS